MIKKKDLNKRKQKQQQSIPENPPPPLPSQPPPSLPLNYANQNNIKITPLLICTSRQPTSQLIKSNICTCNFCLLNLNYLNSKIRSSTPEIAENQVTKTEPIIYIDSTEDCLDMNQFLTKLKSKNDETPTDVIKNNIRQKIARQEKRSSALHDYHLIDKIENKKSLTPSNSVESFEFLNLAAQERPIAASYEKSWENSTIILLNNLQQKLNTTNNSNSSLIAVNCCSLRQKNKSTSSILLANNNNQQFLFRNKNNNNNNR